MITIIVYTSIYNKYDKLPLVRFHDPTIDYICLTDDVDYCQRLNIEGHWKIHYFAPYKNPTDCNRLTKLFPSTFNQLINSDYSLYIDANIDIIGDIRSFIATSGCSCVSTYEHFCNHSVFDELNTCAKAGFISIIGYKRVLEYLKKIHFKQTNPFQECSVILRNNTNSITNSFDCIWWSLYRNFGPRRDQIWFDLALHLSNAPHVSLGDSDPRHTHIFFSHRLSHTSKLKIKQRLIRKINQLVFWYSSNTFHNC